MNWQALLQTAGAMIIAAAVTGIWHLVADGHEKLTNIEQMLMDKIPAIESRLDRVEGRVDALDGLSR